MWKVRKKVQNVKHFPTLHSNFSNYDYQSANQQCLVLFWIICENFSSPSLTVKKWWTHLWKVWRSKKVKHFPTLHSHFSNYGYGSINHQYLVLFCIISENFSFPSLKVKKWRTQLWKVRKSSKCQTFSNSAQSFFQLWLPKCKSSIFSIVLNNLWKFHLSIINYLEMVTFQMLKTQKYGQSWKKRCRVGKIGKNTVFRLYPSALYQNWKLQSELKKFDKILIFLWNHDFSNSGKICQLSV